MVKNHSEKNEYKQLEYDKPSTTVSKMIINNSEEKVRAWLTSEKNIHNSMEQDNEFNILDLTDADIVMLDSTPEKFHESAYNPDVLIEVPYNIVIQDIENVDQTPVISTNNSVIDISLQNVGINYFEPLVEPVSVQSTPEKMSMLSSNPELLKLILSGLALMSITFQQSLLSGKRVDDKANVF
ncbi:hypothetical protein ACI65C_005139 [Semiaphis heraclei]